MDSQSRIRADDGRPIRVKAVPRGWTGYWSDAEELTTVDRLIRPLTSAWARPRSGRP